MCLTPIRVKARKTKTSPYGHDYVATDGLQVVPCGKCPKCKLRRANGWIMRLLNEESKHHTALFITLTYDENNIPIAPSGYMTLVKRDFQLFMKRLRKNTKRTKIKYYACGEYGTQTWRPHYHAIIFDVTTDELDKAWQKGHVWCSNDVNGATIGYCTKYICKESRIPVHAKDDRQKEFSLMSKNLGLCYLTEEVKKYHRENWQSFVYKDGGFKQALPRYYRDKIFDEEQKQVLNYINQQKHSKDLSDAIKEAGSSKDFYRNRYHAIKQALYNEQRKQTQTRNKI